MTSPNDLRQETDRSAYYAQELKRHGLKATRARLAVLSCLEESEKPLTPQELMQAVRRQAGAPTKVDQVSIYRILETFYQLELVHQVHPSKGYMLCQHRSCQRGLHVLTLCQDCGQAEEKEVPFEVMGPMVWYLEKVLNFQPKDHFFQIAGRCRNCLAGENHP